MIEGIKYTKIIRSFYSFLEIEYEINDIKETINGNAFYDIEYKDSQRIISISYENIEDHLEVIVFKLINGKMPDYDDKSHTLHLKKLKGMLFSQMSEEELENNENYFSKYEAKNKLEKKILTGAKDLRLCLIHFEKHSFLLE